MSKIGIIDIGSNTFNLLVFCTKQKEKLYNTEIFVGIRKGTKKKIINKNTVLKSISTLNDFKNICKKFECQKIYVIATASLRNAINKEKFIKECKKHTDLLISVISGETEANLIYEGVSNNIKKIKNFVIVDIGGASTEFIVVKNKKAVFKKSYSFGSQSLVQKFKPSDPIIEKEIEIIKTYFKNNLTDLIQSLRKHKVKNILGSSGSFNCISNIQNNNSNTKSYQSIDTNFYKKNISEKILKSTIIDREKIKGLSKMRSENIIITIILINFLFENQIKKIYTTESSLKEGVLLNIFKKNKKWQESLL